MTDLQAEDLATFKNGQSRIMVVSAPTTRAIMKKQAGGYSEVQKPVAVGDVLLADAAGRVIVPPINFQDAVNIATAILNGDERTITESNSMRALAITIVALSIRRPEAPPEPIVPAMTVQRETAHG